MKVKTFLIIIFLFNIWFSHAQVGINIDGGSPDNSAMFDVRSTTKGILFPRMTTTQISAIPGPANGLVVFCTTDNKFYAFIAAENSWKELLFGPGTIAPPFTCGSTVLVNHVAGDLAPVTKTTLFLMFLLDEYKFSYLQDKIFLYLVKDPFQFQTFQEKH